MLIDFAGIVIAISKILPISYGIRTEIEGLRVLVWVIPKISQMSWMCTNNSVWRSVKIKSIPIPVVLLVYIVRDRLHT